MKSGKFVKLKCKHEKIEKTEECKIRDLQT